MREHFLGTFEYSCLKIIFSVIQMSFKVLNRDSLCPDPLCLEPEDDEQLLPELRPDHGEEGEVRRRIDDAQL